MMRKFEKLLCFVSIFLDQRINIGYFSTKPIRNFSLQNNITTLLYYITAAETFDINFMGILRLRI